MFLAIQKSVPSRTAPSVCGQACGELWVGKAGVGKWTRKVPRKLSLHAVVVWETALISPLKLYDVQTFCKRRLDRLHWIDRSADSVACRHPKPVHSVHLVIQSTMRTAYAQVGNTARFSHGLPPSVAIP
jgi:hypothetical protein